MQADQVFQKTARGQIEVAQKSAHLTMRERRVLILLNGQRSLTQVQNMSLIDNIDDVIDKLNQWGLITRGKAPAQTTTRPDSPAFETSPRRVNQSAAAPTPEPKDFMQNTLLRFANRVRVAGLLNDIAAAEDTQRLKALIKPWYDAIAETPTGIYRADELKSALLDKLLREETGVTT